MRSLALASILALAPVAVMAASLGVPLNQSVLVSLPAPAHNVFLGNPTVADVAMSDQRHVVVTGKAGGVTNLIVTDLRGRKIFDRQIVVGATAGDRVELINGGKPRFTLGLVSVRSGQMRYFDSKNEKIGIEPLKLIVGAGAGVGALPRAWTWAEPTCSQPGAQA